MNGISKLDYFAVHATEEDIETLLPRTIGGIRDKLIELNYIPRDRVRRDVTNSYSDEEAQLLRPWARYEFAKMMLAERERIKK